MRRYPQRIPRFRAVAGLELAREVLELEHFELGPYDIDNDLHVVGLTGGMWAKFVELATAASGAFEGERECLVCGCTDSRACEGGCGWVGPIDVCSACVKSDEGFELLRDELTRVAHALQELVAARLWCARSNK